MEYIASSTNKIMSDQTTEERPKQQGQNITIGDVLEAVQRENSELHQRIYRLERSVAPMIQLMERFFQQEVENRLHSKNQNECGELRVNALEQLKYKQDKLRYEDRPKGL